MNSRPCVREVVVDVGDVRVQPDDVGERVAGRAEQRLEVVERLHRLRSDVSLVERLPVVVDGHDAGAVEDSPVAGDLAALDEHAGVLPRPRIDDAVVHSALLL